MNDEPVGHSIQCPCGTIRRSVGEATAITEALAPAREVHDLDLPEEDARAMVRPT